MTIDEFTERFFAIERRLGLFSKPFPRGAWWDSVRYDVHAALFAALSRTPGLVAPSRPIHTRAAAWARRKALLAVLRVRTRLFRYELVVFRAPRQGGGSNRVDAAIDDFLGTCTQRCLTISTYPDYYHLPRASTTVIAPHCSALIDDVISAFRADFGPGWDEAEMRGLIRRRLAHFESALESYRNLFRTVRPRLIVITQNGIEKAMFVAARELGIPLIEGQHGLIGKPHLAYSYPQDVDYSASTAFPDVFLALSEYWIRACYYPATERVAVGNSFFSVDELPATRPAGDIMFVAADGYHEALAVWAVDLANRCPERRILYKLHPNQRYEEQSIRAHFARTRNIDVIGADTPARHWLPHVSHVVLIQSTVALEALQARRRVCIVATQDYMILKDIFGLPNVSIVTGHDGLADAVCIPADASASITFFAPFDKEKAASVLSRVLNGPDQSMLSGSRGKARAADR